MNLSKLKIIIKEEVKKTLDSPTLKFYSHEDQGYDRVSLSSKMDIIGQIMLFYKIYKEFHFDRLAISYFKNKKLCIVSDVSVGKEFRGKGYSKLLLKEAIKQMKNKNIDIAILGVYEGNSVAIRIYEKFGFKEYHKRKGEIYMYLEL